MKIVVHRGQKQIGGNIVEISTNFTKIIFDVGLNLDDSMHQDTPEIKGLFSGEREYDGVFLSHYHSDHIGLINDVLTEIPIYMGENSFAIHKAAADYRNLDVLSNPIFIYDMITVRIRDIKITPILCDHSAYDSYMFLIEAEGKRILYTGDFRRNGRLDFKAMLNKIGSVDIIITEGTTLNRSLDVENIEEEFLEEIAVKYLNKHSGPAFIMTSAMNIDRLTTAYNVAKSTDRIFLEDVYVADVATAAGIDAPEPNVDDGIRVFITGGDKQYKALQKYEKVKIGKKAIASKRFLMCVRQSMKSYLSKLNELISFEDGVLFYAMWSGYKEQPKMKEFLEFMKNKGVKIHTLHTSGHADAMTIDELIKSTKPKMIIPIHTENPEWFNQYSDFCEIEECKEIEI